MPKLTPDQMRAMWRVSPASLAATLTQGSAQEWVPAPHLQLLSRWIVDAAMGRRPRIIVNMPPRHGKSELISKWTPVWFLENWPHLNIINCGYGDQFAAEWGAAVRNLVLEHGDRLSFHLATDSKAADRWKTSMGGGMKTSGIGGGITGRGAHLMVIDDPIKTDAEANSFTYRERNWKWYQGTARTRLEPGGAIILCMTRWHDDDLAGRLIQASEKGTGEHWDILNLPAISGELVAGADPKDPASWKNSQFQDSINRKPGEPLWPWRYPLPALYELMRSVGPENWAAQFQGKPANLIGAGNVYKSFSHRNVDTVAFDPRRPLIWSMDFNVDPMCSVILQTHEEHDEYTHLTNRTRQTIRVLQELCLPNSSTLEACEEFCNRTEAYRLAAGGNINVKVYGDRSGDSRKTSGETDYVAIKDFFRHRPGYSVTTHIQRANPSVKDRVNSVNAMLCNAANEVRTIIDSSCKELIQDFREVKWKRDTSGNTTGQIDKSDMKRTHVSDAYGYFVHKAFGLKPKTGQQQGILQ